MSVCTAPTSTTGGAFRLLLAAGVLLLLVGGTAGYTYACSTPVDVSGRGVAAEILSGQDDDSAAISSALDLPASIPHASLGGQRAYRLFRSDLWRWPAHVGLAMALHAGHCDASATALQWIKAGAHARTTDQIHQAGAGLQTAIGSSDNPPELAGRVCLLVQDAGDARMWAVAQAADLPCRLACTWKLAARTIVATATHDEHVSMPGHLPSGRR